ncbi:glycosyltransferase family 61 protein [Rhodocytophaga rosea]|uniref:Glycosyltransferase family 61 protein n=1 Tax=Rhodocytophaga rosea TaxID=2704465 RepID=A0A6C0GRI9_9BACT|nr:glycosyltransferase family 61 protein [Rhodocytophaga rosea]QHT70547.1 glycosyltransferase family 61 protein [Rhodocytophaga rosea]
MKKTLLHDGLIIKRKPPLNYDVIKNAKSFIRLEEYIEPSYLCKLNHAYVSPYGIVFKNGRVVKESVYSMFTRNKNAYTFYKKILLNKVKRVSGDCLVAHNAYYDNYYHWTLEALPRIYSIREFTPQLKLLIHEQLKPFIDQYLSFFTFKEIIPIKDEELILAEKLWLPMHTAPGLQHHEPLIREMAGFIKNSYRGNRPENSFPGKIFISRKGATFRKAVNEDEVFELLKGWGFERIAMEKLSVSEQIELFTNTHICAGIHGAGFSNSMYMTEGKLLLDIIHEDHGQDTFYNLASAFNIDYLRLDCPGVGVQKYSGSDDIKVDVSKLEQMLLNQLS